MRVLSACLMKGPFQNVFLSLLSYVPGIKVGCPALPPVRSFVFHILDWTHFLPFMLDASRLIPPTQKPCQERTPRERRIACKTTKMTSTTTAAAALTTTTTCSAQTQTDNNNWKSKNRRDRIREAAEGRLPVKQGQVLLHQRDG